MMEGHMGKVLFTMHTPVQAITSASCSKFKTTEGVHQFKNIATEVAILVKKYRGSLSGERRRNCSGEFLPL
jgi:hypothetical protein